MLEFTKVSIYDIIGAIIDSSKKCRQSILPKGVHQQFLCKIYDKNHKMVSQYTTTEESVYKAISRDMHAIREGYVECICHQHQQIKIA